MKKEISGVIVPLLTPMKDGSTIDNDAYIRLATRCADAGVDAVFLMGTAGEGYNLASEEKIRGVSAVFQQLHDKVKLICGVLEPSTNHAMAFIKQMEAVGIDYFAVVPPYYDDVDQSQIVSHYQTIAKSISQTSKIIIYNIPGTTGVDILPLTVLQLKQIPNVIGIKNSNPRFRELTELIKIAADDQFAVFQGYEDLAVEGLLAGADGIVPCSASIFPSFFVKMMTYARAHDHQKLEGVVATARELLKMQTYSKYWLSSLKAAGFILKITPLEVSHPYEKASLVEIDNLRPFITTIQKEVAQLLK